MRSKIYDSLGEMSRYESTENHVEKSLLFWSRFEDLLVDREPTCRPRVGRGPTRRPRAYL